MRRAPSFLLCVSFWMLLCAQAFAQDVPPACAASRDTLAFNAGYTAGKSLVRQAWARLNSCDKIDQLEAAVKTAIQRSVPTTSPTQYLQCRFSGMVSGMEAQVNGLFGTCADACFLEGQFVGEIAAIAYCELSILLGGLGLDELLIRGPVETCGLTFEVGCDANFETTALNYSNPFGQCLPFVRAPFEEVFFQAQNNQCAYDPLPPEDP